MLIFWKCVNIEGQGEGELTYPAALCAAYTWDPWHLPMMN